jgi:DNA-binding transcriptional ArsR family regulator
VPNQNAVQLNQVFHGLSDPTRRAVLERLSVGAAPVTELARPFKMALPSFLQHLDVLEECGLVKSRKLGRVRTVELTPKPLRVAETWLEKQREHWNARFDQLDTFLNHLKEQ